MKKRELTKDYSAVQYHKYRGIEYFTARFSNHIILEPVHKEVLDNLREITIDHEILWADSAHTWARNMSLDEQRNHLLERTKRDLDWLLSQKPLREFNKKYQENRERLLNEKTFFLSLAKE